MNEKRRFSEHVEHSYTMRYIVIPLNVDSFEITVSRDFDILGISIVDEMPVLNVGLYMENGRDISDPINVMIYLFPVGSMCDRCFPRDYKYIGMVTKLWPKYLYMKRE